MYQGPQRIRWECELEAGVDHQSQCRIEVGKCKSGKEPIGLKVRRGSGTDEQERTLSYSSR